MNRGFLYLLTYNQPSFIGFNRSRISSYTIREANFRDLSLCKSSCSKLDSKIIWHWQPYTTSVCPVSYIYSVRTTEKLLDIWLEIIQNLVSHKHSFTDNKDSTAQFWSLLLDIAGANAAEWSSILVNTGVYDPAQGLPTHRPTHYAEDVEGAVKWAIEQHLVSTPNAKSVWFIYHYNANWLWLIKYALHMCWALKDTQGVFRGTIKRDIWACLLGDILYASSHHLVTRKYYLYEECCSAVILMLPSSSVAKYRRSRLASSSSVRHRILDGLTRRSRLTNLAVFLLGTVCVVSLLTNFWVLSSPLSSSRAHVMAFSTANWPATRQSLSHLIIVPCHSIWQGTDSWTNEEDWLLEPYQKGPGRVRAFYQHIEQRHVFLHSFNHNLLIICLS